MGDNPNGKPPTQHRKEIVDAVVAHYITSPEHRQHKSLASVAKSLGLKPNTYFYNVADSTDVYHQMLVSSTGESIKDMKQVMDVLKEKAIKGSVPAAKEFLTQIRTVMANEQFMRYLKPTIDPVSMVNDTVNAAKDLLSFAQALGEDEEEARRRIEAISFEVESS